jgi:hypothetical protein
MRSRWSNTSRKYSRADLALELVQPLDVGLGGAGLEHLVLDLLELRLEPVDDREVAVDDRVHQRVEHEGRAVAQHVRLALRAAAHLQQALPAAVADGQHEVAAHEDVDLAGRELVGGRQFHRVEDGEQRVAVLLDLGPLVPVQRVLHREFVQVELVLHRVQLLVGGVLQRDPDEAVRPRQVLADLRDRNVGELAAVLVGDAVDQHVGGGSGVTTL